MKTAYPPVGTSYASGYAKGRHAAKELSRSRKNPYRAGSASYHGWNDGYYDEKSARDLVIARHSAELWGQN